MFDPFVALAGVGAGEIVVLPALIVTGIITQNVTLCQGFFSPFGVFFNLFLIFF